MNNPGYDYWCSDWVGGDVLGCYWPVPDGTGCTSDDDPCTLDVCGGGSCTHPPGNDGAACASDGNPCTNDVCANGACTHPANNAPCPNDGNPCTLDVCGGGVCIHPPGNDSALCTDDDPCTENDHCSAGSCAGALRNCDDGIDCTTDSCNSTTGLCEHAPNDVACNDGIYCNGVETCDAHGCQPGVNPCAPRACREGTRECYGCGSDAECNDGWFCSGVETCVAGQCRPGTPRCIPGQFCSETLQRCVECLIDADCADGNACTKDLCSNHACVRGQPVDCSTTDNSICLLSSCDPATGCVYEQRCNDGDPCTFDTCNPQTGVCGHQDIAIPTDDCAQFGWHLSGTPPTRLLVNDDDDNGNGVADYLDPGPVAGENDLVLVPISIGWAPVFPGCACVDSSHYHVDAGGSGAFALFLHPDQTGDVSFGPGAAPGAVYANGQRPSSACGAPLSLMAVCCYDVHSCTVTTDPVVVLAVDSLTWERADPGNTDLEANSPINGGVRIFPDKLSPGDLTPTIRRQVKLVATVAPPVAGVTVYFKVFDVDDPFDQLNPSMPDVGLIDSTPTSGPDNRPSGEAPWTPPSAPITDSQGKARVTFTVSMQPGNNYRAGASLIEHALSQATQPKADAVNPAHGNDGNWSGYHAPLTRSPILTVWRKLHVETDTMVRPTFSQNTYSMPWLGAGAGPTSTQVRIGVVDPETTNGWQIEYEQFTRGNIELQRTDGTRIVVGSIQGYTTVEPNQLDSVLIHIPDFGNGQSGLACLGGVLTVQRKVTLQTRAGSFEVDAAS